MKIDKKPTRIPGAVFSVCLTMLLSACGGGGSSGDGGVVTSGSSLSAVQSAYESVVLASNGGQHYLQGNLSFSTSSTGALSVNPGSLFFTNDSSLPQSAANGPQLLSVSNTSVAPTLAVPTTTATRYMVNGTVYVESVPAQIQVSYVDGNVLESRFATDGKTVVEQNLGTSYTVVPLSGLISSSPSELFTNSNLGLITNTINGNSLYNTSASWQSGAAYMKAVRQVSGDTLEVGDCVAPVTTGTYTTPCSSTIATLENFFPYTSATDGVTYNIADGQIVTLAGVRAWISNTAFTPTTEYRVYYQSNGAIYSGILTKDGTTLELTPLGGGAAQNFYIFLNGAAVQTLKSVVNF